MAKSLPKASDYINKSKTFLKLLCMRHIKLNMVKPKNNTIHIYLFTFI